MHRVQYKGAQECAALVGASAPGRSAGAAVNGWRGVRVGKSSGACVHPH